MKNKVLRILLYISLIPYLFLIFTSIYHAIFGFRFFTVSYGIKAIEFVLVFYGWVGLVETIPIIPICLMYQIGCLIYIIYDRKKKKICKYEGNKYE